jgi:hypothetical protein
LVARVQAERVGSQTVASQPDGELITWQRPNKPRGMTGAQYRRYPKTLLLRQVSVDARASVDLPAGMPWWWSASEGPGGVVFGALLFVLARPAHRPRKEGETPCQPPATLPS